MDRYNPPPIKTKLKYVKKAHIFKATTQKKSTQRIILLLFPLFSQIKMKKLFIIEFTGVSKGMVWKRVF